MRENHKRDDFSIPCRVQTKDGIGTIISRKVIPGSNNGPGNRRFIVQLDDGRIRTYQRTHVRKI